MVMEGVFLAIFSLILTYVLIGKIRSISFALKLFDKPNERSSHSKITPNLAGISFFIVTVINFYFFKKYDYHSYLTDLLPGLVILFFVGLKDDLMMLSPYTKFIAQLVSILFIIWPLDSVNLNLHGFLGIQELGNLASVFFWIIALVGIINAINLIDGINGLLATLSIIAFSAFGFIFYHVGEQMLFLFSISMIFILLAFLKYNLSKKHQIFMGDTGSLILGFLIAANFYYLFQINEWKFINIGIKISNLPYFAVSIVFIPLFDTLRVFIIRMLNKKSPFFPDRNHIHHIIIDFFHTTHLITTSVICALQLFILLISYMLSSQDNQFLLFLFLTLITIILVSCLFVFRKSNVRIMNKHHEMITS